MQSRYGIFPVLVFALIVGTSVGLLFFPEFIYYSLHLVIQFFQIGGLPFLFVAMIVQALATPIPSEFILMCGGAAFGLLAGWLVGALGSLAAASICFFLSRKGGRPVAIRFIGDTGMEFADKWFNRWGMWAVLIGRFAPIIPFDAVSYSAGLTKMKFRDFLIPTVIGTFPRALFYVFVGNYFSGTLTELINYYPEVPPDLQGAINMLNLILLATVLVVGAILITYWIVQRRYVSTEKRGKSI